MLLALVTLLCCCVGFTESSPEGWTEPKDPILINRGSEIRIKCGVNGEKYSNQHLQFFNSTGHFEIDPKYVTRINRSVVEMVIPNASEQESIILCKLNGQHGISYNDIKVGHAPDNISGVDCVSNNWREMTCMFEKPYNPVYVKYELTYRLTNSFQFYECNQPDVKNSTYFTCTIPNEGYRKSSQIFEIRVNGSNAIGGKIQNFTINNYASVIPAAPEKFQIHNITSNSVAVRWNVNNNIMVFPKPFDFEFRIQPATDCGSKLETIQFYNISAFIGKDNPKEFFSHDIPLKFANTWYDISIRMKISTAPNKEQMWSKWTKLQIITAMKRPEHPPEVDVGSFNIGPSGDVYIYWKHLSKCYQNGTNYTYIITSSDKKNEFPNEQNSFMAIYSKDRFDGNRNTSFFIRNVNSEGTSRDASKLVIPGQYDRLAPPTKIKKVLSNGSYELSWSPSEDPYESVTSYTVFWCVSKSELPNSCESSMNFVQKQPYETKFTYESNQTVNFAVSANSATSTSGMIWARCTTANSNEIGKIKTIWIPRLAATEIEVEWKLECTDSGIVAGYQLEYCPSREPKTLECMEPEKKINITNRLDDPKHVLTGLMPYTTYKIVIRMFSNSTMGPASDPLANTTLEAAPSEVRNLIARNVGNTSVELYWDPPELSNGVLLFYRVWANGKNFNLDGPDHKIEIDNSHITRMNYTLKGLMAYTDYDIAVEVCTKECSKPIQTKLKTTIGKPGHFNAQPKVKTFKNLSLNNFTSARITWEEPVYRAGELDFYEFRTKFTNRDGSIVENIIKTRQRECVIEELCANDGTLYEFSVRGVNVVLTPHLKKEMSPKIESSSKTQSCDSHDQILALSLKHLKELDPHSWYLSGPWSSAVSTSCHYNGSNTQQVFMLMAMMVLSLLIIGAIYYFYKKIKDMKDILVQMPPGLEDLTGDKMKKGKDVLGHRDMLGTPDILRNVDNASLNCEDENGRLLKKSQSGSINGADCSSSIHSDSTRSDIEQDDTVEYGAFGNDSLKRDSVGLQSFLINPVTGEDISPILITPEAISMPTSTPIAEKCTKPNIILNPKMPIPSSGYVTQPPRKVISPTSPINSNGYVTHSMFNPMQSGGGYTPLSAFGKPLTSPINAIDDKNSIKTPIVATTDQEGISGYVTHRQLSDFGHRMQ